MHPTTLGDDLTIHIKMFVKCRGQRAGGGGLWRSSTRHFKVRCPDSWRFTGDTTKKVGCFLCIPRSYVRKLTFSVESGHLILFFSTTVRLRRWQNELGELQSGSGRCIHVVVKNSFIELVEDRFSGFGLVGWGGKQRATVVFSRKWWNHGESQIFWKGLEGYPPGN